MRNADDYIDSLPEERKVICEKIRELIFSVVPEIEERFSFQLPFYHYFGMFMYLSNRADGVAVSFCRGKDLVDLFPQLQSKNRAIVASVMITSAAEIHAVGLQEIVATAASWNREAKMMKLPMVKVAKRNGSGKKR